MATSNPDFDVALDCFAIARNDDESSFFMPLRLRKFIGTIALFVLVIVWALVAMAVAQTPVIFDNAWLSIAYYVIAGLGWVVLAIPIVSWMSRKPAT
jgi:hypothetical protein